MTSRYQQELRERVLAAPVVAPPAPWRHPACAYTYLPVGGLLGVGFGTHLEDGRDLLLAASTDGHGVVDTRDYGKLARDRDPDPDGAPPAGDDLSVPRLGPLAGRRVRIAGLYGGGLHSVTEDGWSVDVAAPDWPSHRVLLSTNGGRYDGRRARTGGTSSTPTTPSCVPRGSHLPGAASSWPRAATSPC